MSYDPILIKLDTPADDFFQTLEKCNKNFAAISTAFGSLQGAFTFMKTSVTGGTDPLNGIDGAMLADGMTAVVVAGNNPAAISFYVLDEDKGGSTNPPYSIPPAVNPGLKRWVLAARVPRIWPGVAAPGTSTDSSIGIAVGDMWLVGTNLWFCVDATVDQAIWLPWLRVGSSEYTVCAGNDPRLPTLDQRAALAGSKGNPSATNKFVTQEDVVTPAPHTSSHAQGGSDELVNLPNGIVVSGSLVGTQISPPPIPPAGYCTLYFHSDNHVHVLTSSGAEYRLESISSIHGDSHLLDTGGDPIQTLPSSTQKAALAGAGVEAPSIDNKYVLEDHPDMSGPRVPLSHASTHEPDGGDTIDRLPGNVKVEGAVDLAEAPTPANPTANRHRIYIKADGRLYRLNSAGVEVEIALDRESIQDLVGAMLDGTLTGITLTYDNGKINASVTYGTAAETACEGNDARLSDERAPTVHDYTKHSESYVIANTGITGATRTKITYDAKGLVTGGTDATTADIADSTDRRYASDAQKTVLQNTSGVNTGDQTDITGNAGTATKLATARTIAGTSFDGSANIDIAHGNLQNPGSNTHAQIDSAISDSVSHIAAVAPHSGHVAHSLATALNDFLVASGAGAFVKKTVAEVKTILGLGSAAYTAVTDYIAATARGQASGVASLDASSLVVENPANATATATASKIPIANASANLDTWVSDAGSSTKGKVQLAGQLGGTAASPTVVGITESGGQALTIGAISAGQQIKRTGTSLVGVTDYYYFPITIDGGGSAITTGAKGDALIPVSGTIVQWTLTAHESGSIVLDLWKDTYAHYPPTVADTITASAKPTLSSAQKAQSSTLTGWTTTVTEGEFLGVNVDSCSTITRATLWLKIQVS
jgi:hypothetical protein